jgi:hypothetical protein
VGTGGGGWIDGGYVGTLGAAPGLYGGPDANGPSTYGFYANDTILSGPGSPSSAPGCELFVLHGSIELGNWVDGFFCGPGGGGGGGGAGAVTKSFSLTTQCKASAQQVMGAVESNFGDFGNFSRWGGLESVVFHPPANMGLGSLIPIDISAFTVTQTLSVVVQSMSPQSMTFTTTPGHLLYPGSITFSASPASPGSIGFNINLAGTVAEKMGWYAGGQGFEDAQWNHFLEQIKVFCKALGHL